MDKVTEEIFDSICDDTKSSSLGLVHICKPYNVERNAFLRFKDADPERISKYARAKEDQADYLVEEIIEISDDGTNDFMLLHKGNETMQVENKEVTNRSRLRCDMRKWAASKLKPKSYGDKLESTHKVELNTPFVLTLTEPHEADGQTD